MPVHIQVFTCEKAVEITNQKEKNKDEDPHIPEPEEQEGMPHHRRCPPAKHREDRNPKYHEQQQKDVARILAVHPPKTVGRERRKIDERTAACGHNFQNAMKKRLNIYLYPRNTVTSNKSNVMKRTNWILPFELEIRNIVGKCDSK
jgi:hypothetical protein